MNIVLDGLEGRGGEGKLGAQEEEWIPRESVLGSRRG